MHVRLVQQAAAAAPTSMLLLFREPFTSIVADSKLTVPLMQLTSRLERAQDAAN